MVAAPRNPADPGPTWTGVAPALADGFVGRPEIGRAAEAALVPGATVALVSDRAVAGHRNWRDASGKTQLAGWLGTSLWQAGTVHTVVWVTATSRASVLSTYAEAAVATGITPSGAGESVAARFAGWLRETERPWLVVLDDLADASLMERLWPQGPCGRVLITTTHPAALAGHPARILPVGQFSRREALTYLVGRITVDPDQRQGAIDLVADLDQEPLALALASAVIMGSELTCHDYREHFSRRREQMTGGADPPPAAIAWTLSADHAELLSPGTVHPLLVIAALLDGNAIPSAVFTTAAAREYAGAGSTAIQGALSALEQAGLISVIPAAPGPIIQVSWLVQAASRAAMAEASLSAATSAAADALLEVWPADDQPEWLARSMRSCAESLRRAAGDLLWENGCHEVLLRAGHSLEAARLTGPCAEYWSDLASVSARVLGRGHPATLTIQERQARASLAAGWQAEAVALYQLVRDDRAFRFGPDHPGTAEVSRGLGQALAAAGRLDDAVTVFEGAVSSYQRSLGADSIEVAAAREDLAAAHREAGRFADAIGLYQLSLGQREHAQGARHPDTMTTRQKLAETYLADGQAKAAISRYKKLVADREHVLGAGHLHTIAARGALGSAYHAAGRMASAIQLYEQTRAEYTRALGADHPDTLAACVNLARIYYSVGRHTDAENLLTDAVGRCERNLPPGDPLVHAARGVLANVIGGGREGT